MAISSSPICDEPYSPMETPQCEPTNLILELEYWLIRIWSWAREKNAEKVETKGIFPRADRPMATPTIFCSAINISKNLFGNASLNVAAPVELLTSASSATILG